MLKMNIELLEKCRIEQKKKNQKESKKFIIKITNLIKQKIFIRRRS